MILLASEFKTQPAHKHMIFNRFSFRARRNFSKSAASDDGHLSFRQQGFGPGMTSG
jgi:hypothetical protein